MMGLNISKGNMYEFVTHTWNTVKGECPHGCSYCYMHRWGKQKPVRFDEKELKTDLGTGNFIFVGSSCDLFYENYPVGWIIKTLQHCRKFDNNYLFQSKDTIMLSSYEHDMPEKTVVCTTIETNRHYPIIMKVSPTPNMRAFGMNDISIPKYLTIEPIMDFDLKKFIELIKICGKIEQVNIGADTGRNNLPEPPAGKLIELIAELNKFTTIHRKSNLSRILKEDVK